VRKTTIYLYTERIHSRKMDNALLQQLITAQQTTIELMQQQLSRARRTENEAESGCSKEDDN
jgi:hypothetical protein